MKTGMHHASCWHAYFHDEKFDFLISKSRNAAPQDFFSMREIDFRIEENWHQTIDKQGENFSLV